MSEEPQEPKDPLKPATTKAVDLAYTLWNKELPNDPDQKRATYRAWHLVLRGCPYEQIEAILVKLNKTDRYLPTPGLVYEHWQQTQPDAEPTASQAWNTYCHLRDTINSGTAQPDTHITEKLKQVIRIVGLSLSTGADREHFKQTYNQHTTLK
jgi:hypothetical protein